MQLISFRTFLYTAIGVMLPELLACLELLSNACLDAISSPSFGKLVLSNDLLHSFLRQGFRRSYQFSSLRSALPKFQVLA